MNDHQSHYSHMDDDRSSSPKRKKIRQKYAPKACVSCRRSKLKCTGENPCQRCVDNGKRCFYSEDQTAAEVLQNLSRPTPTSSSHLAFGTSTSTSTSNSNSNSNSNGNGNSNSNGNGNGNGNDNNNNNNGASRRNTMSRNEASDRRQSEASGTGMSMETRMARIEAMMEALMQERGLSFTPRGSIEREEHASDGFRSESTFSMPILDPIHPALQQIGQPSAEHTLAPTVPVDPLLGSDMMPSVRLGNRNMPFPDPARYQQYVASFFGHVHLRHPCVDEVEFNARVQQLMTSRIADKNDAHFLALCYLLFACCDLVLEKSSSSDKPTGSDWYQLADTIIDKNSLLGGGDVTFVQCLLFQAIYLTYADLPALAYSAIRNTCTTILQQNLHKQSMWQTSDPERVYWHTCVLWTAYITDHSISLSCGRPTSLYISDIEVETPQECSNRISLPQDNADDIVRRAYSNQYIAYMVAAVHLAVHVATECSKGTTLRTGLPVSSTNTDDFFMQQFIETNLPGMQIPNFPPQDASNPILKSLMAMRRTFTPLLVGRRIMTGLAFNGVQIEYFDRLVAQNLADFRNLNSSMDIATISSYRLSITTAVTATLLVSGALILHIPSTSALWIYQPRYDGYIDAFVECAAHLRELAKGLSYAKRVHEECATFIDIGLAVVERWREVRWRKEALVSISNLALVLDPVREILESRGSEIFPYQASNPPLQGDMGSGGNMLGSVARAEGSGVLWLF